MNIFRKIALAAVMIAAPFTAAQAVPFSGDGNSRYIRLYNESDYAVYHLYYAVPGESYYSRDLLAAEVLDPNYNISVLVDDGTGRCTYWLKAVTRSGETQWEKMINVCEISKWTLNN